MSESIILGTNDRVIVKQLWKFPVPTAHEVKLLFDFFPDYSQELVGLGFLGIEACRPVEVTRLRWPRFRIQDMRVLSFTHYVNKAVGRTTRNGKNFEEKELCKHVHSWSPWLSQQIIGYAKTCRSYDAQHLFAWTSSDGISKVLTRMRREILRHPKKYGSMYDCFFDKNSYVRAGPDQPIPYRINPYSLRRFAFTFHYYVTFKQDPIATAKFFGHSEAATTLGHYVMPKEAIGLTQQMIDDGISIDEFIHLQGKKQMRLVEYDPSWEQRFIPLGQRTLAEFGPFEASLVR